MKITLAIIFMLSAFSIGSAHAGDSKHCKHQNRFDRNTSKKKVFQRGVQTKKEQTGQVH